ncbi:MAG: hypothetical protein RLY14_1661 [Planctomycetota bacterium]
MDKVLNRGKLQWWRIGPRSHWDAAASFAAPLRIAVCRRALVRPRSSQRRCARKNPGKPEFARVSLLLDRIHIRSWYHGGGATAVAPPPPFCKPESAGGVAGGGAEIFSGFDTVLSCPPQPTKLSVTSSKPNPIKRFMPFPFLGS